MAKIFETTIVFVGLRYVMNIYEYGGFKYLRTSKNYIPVPTHMLHGAGIFTYIYTIKNGPIM